MSKYATMVPARIRVETRPRSLAVPASWPRCSISCTVRCESCDQRETLAEAGINYVLSGHGLSNGHHCRICGRVRPKDRKSTRLNSSHSQISYAVFCLKKNTRHEWSSTRCDH